MSNGSKNPISLGYKIVSYVVTWFLALVATDPSLGLWSLAWMFLLGLYAFGFPADKQHSGWGALIVGAVIYVVQAFFYFRSRTRRSTILWYAVLVILLMCNVKGCRSMIPSAQPGVLRRFSYRPFLNCADRPAFSSKVFLNASRSRQPICE